VAVAGARARKTWTAAGQELNGRASEGAGAGAGQGAGAGAVALYARDMLYDSSW